MELILHKTFKSLKINYVIHLVILIIMLIFNFILVSQILWLRKIFGILYMLMNYISIINFIFPIISFIFIIKNKITKKNVNKFKIITIIFCTLSVIFGFFFSGVLMINAIESPEFCKECPFNLPLSDINSFSNYNLNKKCNERRCINNSQNPEINKKNENKLYEYICNYNPTDEFDEIKESQDIENNNNTISRNSDNIFCTEITKDDISNIDFENNYSIDFYSMCNIHTKLYICERNQLPNKFNIENDFVCPEKDYMTKLVIYCMLNVLINLIFGFFPWKSELYKYNILIMNYEPRRTNQKANSFSSTINDSKGIKENISENNFERTPTEIIIVCGNKNNNITNSINDIHNNNNINNIIKKKSTKQINIKKNVAPSEEKNDNIKNKTEIKLTKKLNINDINILNNNTETNDIINETERNLYENTLNENIEQKNNKDEIRVTIYDKNNKDVTNIKKIKTISVKK